MGTERRKKTLAPAKLNLFLKVGGIRDDGYHEVVTIMQTVDLYDELVFTVARSGGIELISDGGDLPPAEDNLVVRAARLLQRRFNVTGAVRIGLKKNIPTGAGLGGGSSDAAAALKALSSLWGLAPGVEQLEGLAAELGSDVPFFIRGGAALCRGRGEVVSPLDAGSALHFVIAMPPVGISTTEAYAVLDSLTKEPGDVSIEGVADGLGRGDPDVLGSALFNDFRRAACVLNPQLVEVERKLERAFSETGSCGFGLSGSGSAWFALYRSRGAAVRGAGHIRESAGIAACAVRSVVPGREN